MIEVTHEVAPERADDLDELTPCECGHDTMGGPALAIVWALAIAFCAVVWAFVALFIRWLFA